MEKTIVLYEKGNKFEKAYVQTLAGEQIVVSKVLIDNKYFEIMVFKTDGNGRVLDYNQFEEHSIVNPTIARLTFEDVIEKWSNETRTLLEIKPDHIVCEA